jgi:hypothetical protein
MVELYIHSPLCLHGIVLIKHRDNFTFYPPTPKLPDFVPFINFDLIILVISGKVFDHVKHLYRGFESHTENGSLSAVFFCVNVVLCTLRPCDGPIPFQGADQRAWRRAVFSEEYKLRTSVFFFLFLYYARCSVVDWGTTLQAGRSRVQFPVRSLDFFNLPNPSSRTMALGST